MATRHPRYTFFVLIAIVVTLYLLTSGTYGPTLPSPSTVASLALYDPSLSTRIRNAEIIYNEMLSKRTTLINHFGPSPSDIALFPPDKDPWPAYTVWDFFPAAFNCPHEVQRIGAMGDGGKWVCGLSRLARKQQCVVYSVGINYESSFEAELLAGTDSCEIWGYDFTVIGFGPQIREMERSTGRKFTQRTHFFPYGMSGSDRMSGDEKSPLYTLKTMMKLNGHSYIDLLKIDIESWEFETLTRLVSDAIASDEPLPFGQLQLEIHLWGKSFAEFLTWWESLEKVGLRAFWTEPNIVYGNYAGKVELAEYSFINIRGDNVFIADPTPSKMGEVVVDVGGKTTLKVAADRD